MATRKEKEAARKGSEKAADEAARDARDEGAEASLAVRESSELDAAADESDEANEESQEGEQSDELAAGDSEESVARQLGADRYVMAGFFAFAILGGYVLGKMVQSLWSNLANRDWFNQALPSIAAVPDESRTTYAMVFGGLVSLVLVLRTYRRPDVREWTDDVASELMKVKWPTKKDVTNSTLVVIAASSFATLYLALLDRLWSFVTSIVYRTGS